MELYKGIKNKLRLDGNSLGSNSIEYFCSFPDRLKFKCLPGCALCCSEYKVPLTKYDSERLKKTQKAVSPDYKALKDQGDGSIIGFINDDRIKGCAYLSEDKTCSIYADRPLYCRTFPFIRDSYFKLEMSVDYSCPGVGCGDQIKEEAIKEIFLIEQGNRGNRLDIEKVLMDFSTTISALKSKNIYTEYEHLIYVSNKIIEKCFEGNNSLDIARRFESITAQLQLILKSRGNILEEEAAEEIAHELINRADVKKISMDKSRLDLFPCNFSVNDKPLKICLFDQVIPHCELVYKKEYFYISSGNISKQLRLADIKSSAVSAGALKKLYTYLSVWLSRQSLLRFSHSMGLIALNKTNILNFYFDFISLTAERVLFTAEIIKNLNKRKAASNSAITLNVMKEAIRSNDNVLRSKCLSMITINN